MLKIIKLGRFNIRIRTNAISASFLAISVLFLLHFIFEYDEVNLSRSRSVCKEIKGNEIDSNEWSEVKGNLMQPMIKEREKMTFQMTPNIHISFQKKEHCDLRADAIKWSMVYVVKSAAFNVARRKAIRETWASVKGFENIRVEIVFVIGLTNNATLQNILLKESESQGDILQFAMEDSAKTVPEKVLAGMQWVSENLPENWIYSSLDDDVVVQVPNLLTYLDSIIRPEHDDGSYCPTKLPIVCVYNYQDRDVPNRSENSKWYISNDEYSGRSWPKYCRGGLYSLPVKTVAKMFVISRTTHYLYMDDVWITGFMRRKLGDGDTNIIPAPNSIRSDFSFYFNFFNSRNTLAQHLWGNVYYIYEKVDVVDKLYKVWDAWRNTLLGHQVCISY